MIKVNKDLNILTDAEVDKILLQLEAVFANTGDAGIFVIIDILMKDTQQITQQNADYTCCTCGL